MITDFLVEDALSSGFHTAPIPASEEETDAKAQQELRKQLAETWSKKPRPLASSPVRGTTNDLRSSSPPHQAETETALAAASVAVAENNRQQQQQQEGGGDENEVHENLFGSVALLRYNRAKCKLTREKTKSQIRQKSNSPRSPLRLRSAAAGAAAGGDVETASATETSSQSRRPNNQTRGRGNDFAGEHFHSSTGLAAGNSSSSGLDDEDDSSAAGSAGAAMHLHHHRPTEVPHFHAPLPSRRPPSPPKAGPTAHEMRKHSILACHDRKIFLRGQRELCERKADHDLKKRMRRNLLKLLPKSKNATCEEYDDDDAADDDQIGSDADLESKRRRREESLTAIQLMARSSISSTMPGTSSFSIAAPSSNNTSPARGGSPSPRPVAPGAGGGRFGQSGTLSWAHVPAANLAAADLRGKEFGLARFF